MEQSGNKTNNIVPAVFIHIQKTAGSAVVKTARKLHGNYMISHGDYLSKPVEDLESLTFISGHFGYDYIKPLLFKKQRFAFTFLRNPIDRVLSLYYFCRERDPDQYSIYKMAHELDALEFVTSQEYPIPQHIKNNQVWQLACGYDNPKGYTYDSFTEKELLDRACNNSDLLNFIGFKENFNDDFYRLSELLNLEPPSLIPKVNVTNNRPLLDEIDSGLIDAISEIVSLDIELYDYAKKRYQSTGSNS